MVKCIVKTTGQFMLVTRSGFINVGVATVVDKDEFVAARLRNGNLELLADNLPAGTTQADLEQAGSVEALLTNLKETKPESPDLTKNPKKKGV